MVNLKVENTTILLTDCVTAHKRPHSRQYIFTDHRFNQLADGKPFPFLVQSLVILLVVSSFSQASIMTSHDLPNEHIPLQPPSTAIKPGNSQDEAKGWFVSQTKMILLAVLFIILAIIIIVLAVLYGLATAAKRQELEKHDENATEHEPSTVMSTPIVPTTPGTEAWWNPRLPTNINPKHYNLFLNITVDLPRFDGRVGIDIEVNKKTDLIILHNEELNISSVQVISKKDNGKLTIKSHFSFPKYTYHVIQMFSELEVGSYLLQMRFQGSFRDVVAGMFRKSFIRPNGQKAFFAATQFQKSHARKAFPCFDEPALKATFNVSIGHRSDYVALCNMPIYKTEKPNHQTIDYYGKTVTMPTYLLAFVVGDFKYVEKMSKNNIMVRIYSRPSYLYKTEYAWSVSGKILSFFEDYLGVRYSLPKEDHIAVPGFGAAAMENWGLIIYGEEMLLWDPNESTAENKQTVTELISHEIAHQFFGNLVTCKWWDDLWLNEGFATYFSDAGIASVLPSWKRAYDAAGKLVGLLENDADASSHPIKLSKENVDHYWSTIIYNKGSLVIRMLEGFLGNDTFLEGLKIYFKRHLFGSVESDDLWRALTEASCARGKCVDVKQVMDTWILQAGYPVLTLEKINSSHYQVSQKRFLTDKKDNLTALASKSPFGYSWVVPLPYAIQNHSSSYFTWMNKSSTVIEWNGKGWIKLNLGHKGYFITKYDEEHWKALALQLKQQHTIFSSSDRSGLLVDAFLLSKFDKLKLSTAIEMTEFMEKETEYGPWKVTFQALLFLRDQLPRQSKAYQYLMKYMMFLGKNQYESLGFNDIGNMVDKLKRSYFLSLFCSVGEKTCIGNATKLFKAWMKNSTSVSIPPNFRDVVYFHGVSQGGVEAWDFLYSQYNKTNNPSNMDRILYGLSAARDPWIIDRYLSYALEQGAFQTGHAYYVFYYVNSYNPLGSHLIWNFLRANWNRVLRRFDNSPTAAYFGLVSPMTKKFHTSYAMSEVQRFQTQINVVDNVALESITRRIKWLEKNEKQIENVLEKLLKKNNQM